MASTNAGRTWTAPLQIDDPGPGAQGAAAFKGSGLDIVASWLQGDPAIITVDHSHDGGITWSPDILISRAVLGRPTLLATTGTGAFELLTWPDGTTGSLQMSTSIDAGRSWSGVELIAPTSALAALVALPDGRVAVAYTVENMPGAYDTWIRVSPDRGVTGSFGPPALLITNAWRTDDLSLVRGTGSQPWLLQVD